MIKKNFASFPPWLYYLTPEKLIISIEQMQPIVKRFQHKYDEEEENPRT